MYHLYHYHTGAKEQETNLTRQTARPYYMKQSHLFSLECNSNALFKNLFGNFSIDIHDVQIGRPIFSGAKIWHGIELYLNQSQLNEVWHQESKVAFNKVLKFCLHFFLEYPKTDMLLMKRIKNMFLNKK